jgi:hypothetical protein
VHKVLQASPGERTVVLAKRTDVIWPGDTLAFFDASGGYLFKVRVSNISDGPDGHKQALLEQAPPRGDLAFARDLDQMGSRYVIANNRIGPCGCHGVLAQTPNGIIEHNVFNGLKFNAFRLLTSLDPWLEGMGPFNIAVQDNQIRDTGGERNKHVPHAAIAVYLQNNGLDTSSTVGADVAILRNTMENVAQGCVYAERVQNLVAQGNRCEGRGSGGEAAEER